MGKRSGIAFIFILIIAALAIGTVAYVGTNPDLVNTITQKIKDIITPGAPIGNLTPARDLTGTWVSSLKGKGMELYGSFPLGGAGTAVVYQNSDVTLKITSVSGNTASGSRLDFGTVSAGGATVTMQGNFTTDLISGTMTMTSAYGVIKGEFHLIRKK